MNIVVLKNGDNYEPSLQLSRQLTILIAICVCLSYHTCKSYLPSMSRSRRSCHITASRYGYIRSAGWPSENKPPHRHRVRVLLGSEAFPYMECIQMKGTMTCLARKAQRRCASFAFVDHGSSREWPRAEGLRSTGLMTDGKSVGNLVVPSRSGSARSYQSRTNKMFVYACNGQTDSWRLRGSRVVGACSTSAGCVAGSNCVSLV